MWLRRGMEWTGDTFFPRAVRVRSRTRSRVSRVRVLATSSALRDAASDLEGLSDADREALIDAETEDLVYDYQHEHTEDFLRELVAYLVEPFIVQTAGYEKC